MLCKSGFPRSRRICLNCFAPFFRWYWCSCHKCQWSENTGLRFRQFVRRRNANREQHVARPRSRQLRQWKHRFTEWRLAKVSIFSLRQTFVLHRLTFVVFISDMRKFTQPNKLPKSRKRNWCDCGPSTLINCTDWSTCYARNVATTCTVCVPNAKPYVRADLSPISNLVLIRSLFSIGRQYSWSAKGHHPRAKIVREIESTE